MDNYTPEYAERRQQWESTTPIPQIQAEAEPQAASFSGAPTLALLNSAIALIYSLKGEVETIRREILLLKSDVKTLIAKD